MKKINLNAKRKKIMFNIGRTNKFIPPCSHYWHKYTWKPNHKNEAKRPGYEYCYLDLMTLYSCPHTLSSCKKWKKPYLGKILWRVPCLISLTQILSEIMGAGLRSYTRANHQKATNALVSFQNLLFQPTLLCCMNVCMFLVHNKEISFIFPECFYGGPSELHSFHCPTDTWKPFTFWMLQKYRGHEQQRSTSVSSISVH